MATKFKYQVEQVPAGSTAAQIESFLNQAGQNGWEVIQFIVIGNNVFAIAKKDLSS